MDIKKMILDLGWDFNDSVSLRFKYYGDFETMKMIHSDCKNHIEYIGNSNVDAAPVFIYELGKFDKNLLYNFKELNVYLRNLKIRKLTTKDLTDNEKSILTFFRFFMNSDENMYIKGASDLEIHYLSSFNNHED